MSCGTGAALQCMTSTAIDKYLTHNAHSTFFAARSAPYAVFATDFSTLQLSGATTLSEKSSTMGNAVIDRRGDRLAKIYLDFIADAICNISQDAVSMYGASAAAVADNAASAVVLNRGIVGGLGHKLWVPVVLAAATAGNVGGATCASITAVTGLVAMTSGASTANLRIGDRVTFGGIASGTASRAPQVGYVQSISSADTVTFTASIRFVADAGTGLGTILVEREVNRGLVDGPASLFLSEDADFMPFSLTKAEGPRPSGTPSALGVRYSGPGGDARDLACYYRPFAPALLIDTVSLLCGSQCLDQLTASAIIIYHEVFVPLGKKTVRSVNGSRDPNVLKRWAMQAQHWRLLLPFHMCTSYSKALSLVSICLHNLKISIKFNPCMHAVHNGVGGVFSDTMAVTSLLGGTDVTNAFVRTCAAAGNDTSLSPFLPTPSATSTLSAASALLFKGGSIQVQLVVEYVYSGKAERELEVNLTDVLVVTEHQSMSGIVLSTTAAISTQLTFGHPVSAIFITPVASASSAGLDMQNYDGCADPLTFNRNAPRASHVPLIKSAQIKFNSGGRTPEGQNGDGLFFREIQHGNVGECVPNTDILGYYFCVANPYLAQHSGSAALARLDRADIVLTPNAVHFKDMQHMGGLNATATSAGAGAMSSAQQITCTIDVLSINVWTVSNCMLGRMFA